MDEVMLRVSPAANGWTVESSVLEPTFFRSGARAEAEARRLALHFSLSGRDVCMLVQDRAERLVTTHRYFEV